MDQVDEMDEEMNGEMDYGVSLLSFYFEDFKFSNILNHYLLK